MHNVSCRYTDRRRDTSRNIAGKGTFLLLWSGYQSQHNDFEVANNMAETPFHVLRCCQPLCNAENEQKSSKVTQDTRVATCALNRDMAG